MKKKRWNPESELETPETQSDIDTVTEVSQPEPVNDGQTHSTGSGQELYDTYVSIRHAKFNDGGSYLPWNQMQQHERDAWNETASKFKE